MRHSRRKPKFYKTAINYAAYGLMWALNRLILSLPFRAASFLGEWTGVLAYHLGTGERNRTLRHLRWAFEDTYSRGERRALAFNVFRNLGRGLTETLAGSILPTRELVALVENWEEVAARIQSVLDEGKGVIVMGGHLGCFDLLGNLGARHFPVSVVVNRFNFEPFNRIPESMRLRVNLNVIYLNESPREIVRALKRNDLLGLHPDQDIRRLPGTYVTFFGRPAWTPVGPVLTAKVSGAPMIPSFLIRRGMKYRVEFGDRIPLVFTGDRRRDAYVNTQRWSDVYEEYIRRYPDQWTWNHSRWKTRPSDVPPAFRRFATFPADMKNAGTPARRREPENSA